MTHDPSRSGVPRDFEMYTAEGDAALHEACGKIADAVERNVDIRNRATLREAAKPIIRDVADRFPEVTDTEPRNHIAAFLDQVCEANGWAFDPYEPYDLV